MGSIPNTIRRAGIYHFRIAIPTHLQSLFKRAEITCSLRTSDPATARTLSRRFYLGSGELFDRVMTMPALTDEDISAMVRDFFDTMIERDNAIRWKRDDPISGFERTNKIQHYRELADNSRAALADDAYEQARQVSMVMLARRFGIDAQFGKTDRRKLQQALLRAGIDLADTLRARLEGDFNYEPKDKLLAAALRDATSPAQCDAAESAISDQPSPAPAETSPDVPIFGTYAEDFRETQTRRRKWESQTSRQARKTYSLFAELCGDRPLAGYLRTDAYKFKALLEDLPADYGKAAQYRGMSATDIVSKTAEADVTRLSARTVQRHFHALATLWDQAIAEGLASDNIFHNWKFGAARRARDQRSMWESAELKSLFASPIWAGCQSTHRRAKPGQYVIRDEKFWLPLIAVFSGMRQEEICQLQPADIREVENIWVFDINDRDGQQLKNENAIRLVPIHPELIKLGWLGYVAKQRKARQKLLFRNLRPGGADDRLGHNYSKWFTRYRRDVDLYAPGRDFHSFRHSATTFLKRGGVADSVIDELTGHATAGETARYSKGLTVANLKGAIDRLDIGVDLSGLYPEVI